MSKADELAKMVNDALGAGTLVKASDPRWEVTYLPTGVLPFDVLLNGGLPRGRFVEVFGDYSTLKSYIALRAIATTQAIGGACALIDTEHSFDPEWATNLGVNVDDLLVRRPPTGEDAVDISEVLIRQDVDLLVWDSVAATLPQDEGKKRMSKENIQPARLAALMSAASRRLTSANDTTAVLFINQTRLNVGQMFGDPTSVPGGKALPFYASYRVGLRKAGAIKTDSVAYRPDTQGVGKLKKEKVKSTVQFRVKATVEKSKLSAPFKDTYLIFDLTTGEIDDVGFLMSQGLERGWITKTGTATYEVDGKTVRGIDSLRGLIEATPQLLQRMKDAALSGSETLAKSKGGRRNRKSSRA